MNLIAPLLLAIPPIISGAAMLDDATNVPIRWVFGCTVTVCGVGMWVQANVTSFKASLKMFMDQRAEYRADDAKRWERFDAHLCLIDDKMAVLSERLSKAERNHR